jgi:hypothetical protein
MESAQRTRGTLELVFLPLAAAKRLNSSNSSSTVMSVQHRSDSALRMQQGHHICSPQRSTTAATIMRAQREEETHQCTVTYLQNFHYMMHTVSLCGV